MVLPVFKKLKKMTVTQTVIIKYTILFKLSTILLDFSLHHDFFGYAFFLQDVTECVMLYRKLTSLELV